ncbi:type I polyketide synthase [Actinomadura sp. NEAU-AAG7]|uniref:type I polyketide synthase n=1 Tax=Actinomadura sp. NEAU-AAG7 TaxID=2839640 RepID=UPI001BE4DF2E|nr:type I polyketide synthase [Actinomadura sp. NEAU-AAG7]MBT2210887.1 type I polyketide synthase [Actinomadura sp. NEAU-AAG7]
MTRDRSLDIAVTGMSGRFPGCADLDAWWSALLAGRVLTRRYERRELEAAGVPASLLDEPDYVPVHGHLDGADRFDNVLFRVSPRDAEMMDPQHRLMLEAAWAALEDAGSAGDLVTGVYASASGSGYLRAMVAGGKLDPLTLEDAVHGTEPDFMASLISYKLGLTGPALAVQTACSSSLVALHMAGQALLNGDCDQALVVAAGIAHPQAGHLHVPGGIHSPSGTCRPFDARADGVVAGSGVAAVVLRRAADAAVAPHGIILGTAINNDGAAKAGYYAPSVAGQEAVIRSALLAADVEADSIGYLESHGTGTRVGDPIEWSAASAALGGMGAAPGQVAVGALKANVGHLDNAAGLASLIKTLLVLRDGAVPPVAGFTRLNPLLDAGDSPLYVPAEAAPWSGPRPWRAGVSSFGIGGTNAHVIVERAADVPRTRRDRPGLVLLSAADPEALTRSAARLSERLGGSDLDLGDVAFTLATGRVALTERLAVSGRSAADVAARLAGGDGVVRGSRPADGPAPVVFLFPGQGSQHPGMALPFAEALPGFADALDQILDTFDTPLAGRLRPALLTRGFPEAQLRETELAQPALFAVEYAADRALRGLGVVPVAVAGHSLGEITALCVAGALDPAEAARFVAARGRALQGCPPGAMLALGCDEAAARELLAASGAALEIAAINTPDTCVVAGTADTVDTFRAWLGDRVFARPLRTGRAFHTSLVEPGLRELAAALPGLAPKPPTVPYAANATGKLVPAGTPIEPGDLVRAAREPVRFADAMAAIAARHPGAVAVEIGPGRALTGMADAAGLTAVALSPSRTARPDEEVRTALGALWTLGQPLATEPLIEPGHLLHLPAYPFAGPSWMAPEAAPKPLPEAEPPKAPEPAGQGAPDAPALLARLWTELLGHADLTAESDFFKLGGDSLLVTHLARRVHRELGVRVPMREMLAGRTLGRQTTIVLDLLEPSRSGGPPGQARPHGVPTAAVAGHERRGP